MEQSLMKNYDHLQICSRFSSSELTNTWQRAVKRKYDETSTGAFSGDAIQSPEDRTCHKSFEDSKGTVRGTSISRGETPLRRMETINTEAAVEPAKGFQQLDCTGLHVPPLLLEDQRLTKGNEFQLGNPKTGDALPSVGWESTAEDVWDTASRRNYQATKRKAQASACSFFDKNTRSAAFWGASSGKDEIILLKEALISERKALQKLNKELEYERCASATAANEAMAMIARLQEEKAAVQMEARQYKRMVEEREAHSQEAIRLLKETVLIKEDDLLALQDELNAYSKMFSRIESAGIGLASGQGNFSIEEKDRTLFIENQEAGSLFSEGSRYDRHRSNHGITMAQVNGDKEVRRPNERWDAQCCNTHFLTDGMEEGLICSDGIDTGYVRERNGGDSWDTKSKPKNFNLLQDEKLCEWQRKEEDESVDLDCASTHGAQVENHSQELNLEVVSMSILARVRRLEERFEHLGANHVPEGHRLNANSNAWQNEPVPFTELKSEVCISCQDFVGDHFYMRGQEICRSSSPERHYEDCDKDKIMECMGTFKGGESTMKESRSTEVMADMDTASVRQDHFYGDSGADFGEGILDIYEVQYETTHRNDQHASSMNAGENTSQAQNLDVFGIAFAPQSHNSGELGHCEAEIDDKLVAEFRLLDVKDAQTNMVNEDVCQLKLRLQALEIERGFMKEAIESLRQENIELKLLQEIAQQLRELKGDVNRSESMKGELQVPLPFLSYFKGLFGIQSSTHLEETRFVCPLTKGLETGLNKNKHGGLYDLLEKSPRAQECACVRRGLKVRLPINGTA